MAAKKLHGNVMSLPTQRALAGLYEKDLEFEFVPVDMRAGEHKSQSFLAMNPFGQIPAFEDGDLHMFESRAITQHVAFAYAGKGTNLIFPEEGKKMATMGIWIQVESQQFDPHASKLCFELCFKAMLGMGPPNDATVAELEGKLAKVLDVYEARLAHSKYMGGDEFGLADLHHLPAVHRLKGTPSKKLFEDRPHVCRWAEEILSRPSWCKVLEMQKKKA